MGYKVVLVLALMAVICSAQHAHPPCACARIYQPVCASNKLTYNNMCEFQCAAKHFKGLTISRYGRCDGTD